MKSKKQKKASLGKLDSFYQGWQSEILAEYVLSEIAFVVPVQVRSDVGADFFCTLFSRKDNLLEPGSVFSVQVKKEKKQKQPKDKKDEDEDITLNLTNLIFLAKLRIPHYLCIANRESSQIEVYSCQQLLPLFIRFGNFAKENSKGKKFLIKLKPIERYSTKNLGNLTRLINGKKKVKSFSELLKYNNISTWNKKKKAKQITLEIGPQIFKTSIDLLKEGSERKRISDELSEWIKLDYFNIHNFSTCIYSPYLKYFNRDNELTMNMIPFGQLNPETFVYSYATTRLAILLEHLNTTDINFNKINTLKRLIELLSIKNHINISANNDIMTGWTETWNMRLKNIYSELSKKDKVILSRKHNGSIGVELS